MKNVLAIARREIKSSFNSPVAYAVILSYLVFTGIYLYFIRGFYAAGQADLRDYFIDHAHRAGLPRAGPHHALLGRGAEARDLRTPAHAPLHRGAARPGQVPLLLRPRGHRHPPDDPSAPHGLAPRLLRRGRARYPVPGRPPRGGRCRGHRRVDLLPRQEPGERLCGLGPRPARPRRWWTRSRASSGSGASSPP